MNSEGTTENIKQFINYSQANVPSYRRFTLSSLIIFIDLFLTFMAFADPYEQVYVNWLLPIIVITHLFALYIYVNPYKRQIVYHLYLATVTFGSALGCLVCAQKIVYGMWEIQSPLFLILSSSAFVAVIFLFFYLHTRMIMNGYYVKYGRGKSKSKTNSKSSSKKNLSFLASGLAVLGTVGGRIALRNGTEAVIMSLMTTVYLTMAACTIFLFINAIQRYYLMLKHRDWIEFVERNPTKKKRKGA